MLFVHFQSTVCLFYFSQYHNQFAKKIFNIEGICLRILACDSHNRQREESGRNWLEIKMSWPAKIKQKPTASV